MQRPYGVRSRKNHKHFVFMTIGEFFLCPIPPDLILYQFEKRMLRIVRVIKRFDQRFFFDKKDDLRPKKWY